MDYLIKCIQSNVVQLASPYTTGTGFYLPDSGYIVTNHHVVSPCKEIIVQESTFSRQRANVIYADSLLDIALLQPQRIIAEANPLSFSQHFEIGDHVIACGHPFGLPFTSTFGMISSKSIDVGGVYYMMHDAALNPGNSGGPLMNKEGQVIGMNSSIIKDGKNIGIALSANNIIQAIDKYRDSGYPIVSICPTCSLTIDDHKFAPQYCQNCGTKVALISQQPSYTPTGMAKFVEELLVSQGIDPFLCRRGQHAWEIVRGSATVHLHYHHKSGFLSGESFLCYLPSKNHLGLYQYLLQENNQLFGLSFGVIDRRVTLSMLIYDQNLHAEIASDALKRLCELSDHYDDILIDKFDAEPMVRK